jgi:hypothetical protein
MVVVGGVDRFSLLICECLAALEEKQKSALIDFLAATGIKIDCFQRSYICLLIMCLARAQAVESRTRNARCKASTLTPSAMIFQKISNVKNMSMAIIGQITYESMVSFVCFCVA